MSAVTFDMLKFAERLERVVLTREQAAAISVAQKDAFSEALDSTLAINRDIDRPESKMGRQNWMIGIFNAIALSNFANQFL